MTASAAVAPASPSLSPRKPLQPALRHVVAGAVERADLVISTGGLGPTQDDLTREVIAAVAGVDLVEHAGSLAHITEMFAKRGRVMPDRNHVQALIPANAIINTSNLFGTSKP